MLGVFDAIWQFILQEYKNLSGLAYGSRSTDCALPKASPGHETGKKLPDRGRKGAGRSLITEATETQTGLSIGAVNTHAKRLLRSHIEDCMRRFPFDQWLTCRKIVSRQSLRLRFHTKNDRQGIRQPSLHPIATRRMEILMQSQSKAKTSSRVPYALLAQTVPSDIYTLEETNR